MAYTDKADWLEVDPSTLQDDCREAYEAYKAAYKVAKAHRATFEALMQPDLPGKRMVFGYNFGKLSVAIVEGAVKVKATAKPKQSLADYLAEQANR